MYEKILLTFLLLFSIIILKAEDPLKLKHNNKSYVADFANLLSNEEENILDKKIKDFRTRSTVEFSIVTVNSLNGNDVAEFTNILANSWGVGNKNNNGCMILISLEPRKLRTEVGYGLEGDLTDGLTKYYQENYAIPLFKENRIFDGLNTLLTNHIELLDPVAIEQRRENAILQEKIDRENTESFKDGLLYFILTTLLVGIGYWVIWYFSKKRKVHLQNIKWEEGKFIKKETYEMREYNKNIKDLNKYILLIERAKKYNISHKFIDENNDLTVLNVWDKNIVNKRIKKVNIISYHSLEVEVNYLNKVPDSIKDYILQLSKLSNRKANYENNISKIMDYNDISLVTPAYPKFEEDKLYCLKILEQYNEEYNNNTFTLNGYRDLLYKCDTLIKHVDSLEKFEISLKDKLLRVVVINKHYMITESLLKITQRRITYPKSF